MYTHKQFCLVPSLDGFVMYIFDANYIQSVPIKNRSKEELFRAFHDTYNWLVLQGFKPQLRKLDNETSHEVEALHCTNPAERAIRTWKNHFLSGMVGLPKSFPIAKWCRLTTQCNATLNMLRPCCQNPRLLVHKPLKAHSPSTQHQWHHSEQEYWCTWNHINTKHGATIQPRLDTSSTQHNTTAASELSCVCVLTRPPEEKDHWPIPPNKAGWHSSFSP